MSDNKYIDPEKSKTVYAKFELNKDDVLLVMVGGSLGKIGIVSEECLPAVLNQNMWKLNRFGEIPLRYFVMGLNYINSNQLKITSSTHGHLAQGEYMDKLFPLPPLAEQHRIVAKVDELMALCDQLERQQTDHLAAHQILLQTLLDTLTQAADAAEFEQAWSRIADHFDTLFTTESSIDQLKQTLLQLAVMGKLVPQDPNDEPAKTLLDKIFLQKTRLTDEGKLKPQKGLPEISEEEKPPHLPTGWELARLGEIINIINGRAYKKHEMLQEGTPLLRVGNLFTSNEWYYSDLELEPDKYIDNGDLIYAWSASFGPFIWQGGKVIYHYHIWKFDLYDPSCLDKQFLFYFFKSITEKIKASGNGIAMIHMTKERMEKLILEIPPLAEQHRIVAKVDELMALCDALKARIAAAQITQLQLADAIVEQAVA